MTFEGELISRGFTVQKSGLNDFQIERDFGHLGAIYLGGRHGRRWLGIDQGIEESIVLAYGENVSDEQFLACADAAVECLTKIQAIIS